MRQAFRDGLLFTATYVCGVTLLLFALRAPIADLFNAQGLARDLVYLFCGPLALAFAFNGVIFVANAAFNNLGHPFYSTLVNWGRHTLGTIPLVALGAMWMGAPGILIGQAAGGLIFGLIGTAMALRVMRKKSAPPQEPFARQARQMSLFHHRR